MTLFATCLWWQQGALLGKGPADSGGEYWTRASSGSPGVKDKKMAPDHGRSANFCHCTSAPTEFQPSITMQKIRINCYTQVPFPSMLTLSMRFPNYRSTDL